MTGRRPLRFVLFLLEIPRLALILVAAAGSDPGAAASRSAAIAAPQALFVLMALFSWFDPEKYDAYRPLYAAGKLVSAFALSAWLFRTAPAAAGAAGLADFRELISTILVAAVALYDIITGVVAGVSAVRPRRVEEEIRDLPPLVVDELPDDAGGS